MDRLQRYNQRLVRRALKETRLLTALEVSAGRRIRLTGMTWEDYWRECGPLTREVGELKAAWTALIVRNFASSLRHEFVRTYFRLLRECLDRNSRGENMRALLRKVAGFETIRVSGDCGGSAAAIVSARHPVYILSKLAGPNAPENPKYLPLVCPCGVSPEANAVFWHYRRIPLTESDGVQLFVYPPARVCDRPASYALIGRLFACLTTRSDPWIRERSRSLFDGVFSSLVARAPSQRLQLLDMACGSAKVTMTLCRKATAAHRKTFDLTLIDVIRGNQAIANAFYRNPKVFGNVAYRREDIFEWVDKNSDEPETRFDIALLLRACNLFSRFTIEEISCGEVNSLIGQDHAGNPVDPQTLRPADLIESNQLAKIKQGIGRFIFRDGWCFRQFSSSDYYKAIQLVMGGRLSGREDAVYMPLRAFDDDVLILPSGRSLIAQLLAVANHLVIEDADLMPCHLERHFKQFALGDLSVMDLSDQARRRGAAVFHIGRSPWCNGVRS